MKLDSNDIHIESSGGLEYTFGVKEEDQGILFDMVRSKIYKNPIASICREISSNSRDANREAGNEDTPCEIEIIRKSIEQNGEIYISFKDNGPGISPERMDSIYCKYAASTKRDNNVETGGFGLGAKTPFSYTDAFTIQTVVDGLEYSYIAFIDESKRGKVLLTNKVETDKPNGTNVMVPIKSRDSDEFEKNVYLYTMFWKTLPIYKGFRTKPNTVEYVYESDLFSVTQNKAVSLGSSTIFLIDGIPYPCDYDIGTKFPRYHEKQLLLIPINIGDFTISVNRETLQYTEKTIEKIDNKYNEIYDFIVKDLTDYLSSATNYLEACKRYNDCVNKSCYWNAVFDRYMFEYKWLNSIRGLQVPNITMYEGNKIKTNFSFKSYKIVEPYVNDSNNISYKGFRHNSISLDSILSSNLYKVDTKSRSANRTEVLLEDDDNQSFLLYHTKAKLNDPNFNTWLEEDNKIINLFGDKVKLYSDITPVNNKVKKTKEAGIRTLRCRRLFYSYFASHDIKIDKATGRIENFENIGIKGEKIIYLTTSNMSTYLSISKLSSLPYKMIKAIKFTDDNNKYDYPVVIVINEKFRDLLKNDDRFITLDEHIKTDKYKKAIKGFYNDYNAYNDYRKIENHGLDVINFGAKTNAIIKKIHSHGSEFSDNYSYRNFIEDYFYNDKLAVAVGLQIDKDKDSYINDIIKQYPLLDLVNSYNVDKNLTAIDKYIQDTNNAKNKEDEQQVESELSNNE